MTDLAGSGLAVSGFLRIAFGRSTILGEVARFHSVSATLPQGPDRKQPILGGYCLGFGPFRNHHGPSDGEGGDRVVVGRGSCMEGNGGARRAIICGSFNLMRG